MRARFTEKKGKPVTRSQTRLKKRAAEAIEDKKKEQKRSCKRVQFEIDSSESFEPNEVSESFEISRSRDDEQNLLEGLQLTKDGKYVKLDEKLLNRLTPYEEEIPKQNPFEKYPCFENTLQDGTGLTLDFLENCSQIMKADQDAMKMADIVGNLPLEWLSMKRSEMREDNWDYSVKFPINPKVTDQGQSGRCWLYAALSSLRVSLMRKFNVEHKFEFSESYLFFYDKIERSNMFLECMWSLRHRSRLDREVLLLSNSNSHVLQDGGSFYHFLNLVSKYGLVPKNVYSESFNSRSSDFLNDSLISVLNNMSLEIYRNEAHWTRKDFEEKKKEYMITVYDLVTRFLGEPLKPTDKFDWTYKTESGDTEVMHNLTPEKFYKIVVPHNNENKVVIINDPRHPETYYMPSHNPYSLNIHGGLNSVMINVPMDIFKKAVYESLKNEDLVWFASDVRKCFDSEHNTFDTKRFDYKSVLGTDIEFSKSDMLETMTSIPAHAMVFNGVDAVEDSEGNVSKYTKWRVENSWGMQDVLENDPDFGYFRMTDEYFDKYVYEAAVDIKYLDPDALEKLGANVKNGKSYTYEPYDAFGAVARRAKCPQCSRK